MGRERVILNRITGRSANAKQAGNIPIFLTDSGDEHLDQRLEAQESERRRLVQDLHDSTGHLLLELNMEIGKLRRSPGFADATKLIDAIDEAASHIDQEIRSMAFMRYPQELGDRSLEEALEMFAYGFGRRAGLDVRFRGQCAESPSRECASALLRIAQEALTNAHRHGHATQVRMTLADQRGLLMLRICDNGTGMPAQLNWASDGGVGMRGMAHRAEQLGGNFSVRRLKHGTAVIATVPSVDHSNQAVLTAG